MTHHYFNEWHLGDCLWQCLFLRRMAKCYTDHSFCFYCDPQWIPQLREVVEDLKVQLIPLSERPPEALDCWVGTNYQGRGKFYDSHPLKHDIVAFLLDWFKILAHDSGLHWPAHLSRRDLLFDHPAILRHVKPNSFDFLFVNGRPGSGQFDYDLEETNQFIRRLASRNRVVVTNPCGIPGVFCTEEQGLTMTGIGGLSLWSGGLILGMTGPAWCTFNAWSSQAFRYILLKDAVVNFGIREPVGHFNGVAQLEYHFEQQGIL